MDREARFPWEVVEKMRPLNFFGLQVPKKYGGADLDSISYATYALDELVLTADLSGQNNVYFDCWVRRYYGGMQAMPAQSP